MLSNLLKPNKNQKRVDWKNITQTEASLAISDLAQTDGKPLLIITADSLLAAQLENELAFFLGTAGIDDDSAVIPDLIGNPDHIKTTGSRLGSRDDKTDELPRHSIPRNDVLHFPDWETLMYDRFSPHQDIISERLATLDALQKKERSITIVPITTILHRLAPRKILNALTWILDTGQKIDLHQFRQQLTECGYFHVNQVINHGEFSIRGSIIDVFPMGSDLPYRIDLFDTDIESIRTFDPETQLTIEKIKKIRLLPAKEFPITQASIDHFREHWRLTFDGNPLDCPLYNDISKGIPTQGIEYYSALFFDEMETLFHYLPAETTVIVIGDVKTAGDQFWETARKRYEQISIDSHRPILPPERCLLETETFLKHVNEWPHIRITLNTQSEFPDITINNRSPEPLEKLKNFITNTNTPILFCAETLGRREVLLELFKTIPCYPTVVESWQAFCKQPVKLGITIGSISHGLQLRHFREGGNPVNSKNLLDPRLRGDDVNLHEHDVNVHGDDIDAHDTAPFNLTLIAENQLFGEKFLQQKRRRKQRVTDQEAVIKSLAEIKIGDPVVHINEGVGRFLGLQNITIHEAPEEFLVIEYAGNNKLYVPITSLHLISRYTGGDSEHAPLHSLGSEQWEKAKRKAAEKVKDVAAELLLLYSQRQSNPGFTFKNPPQELAKFCNEFPFEETPDQQRAIEQVLDDMFSSKAMDRLVCGDVGFGKTEVAMRACFVAAMSGKQVAVLVPTTLLANQHYENFKDRFANWPVNIQVLSRFVDAKHQKQTLSSLEAGKVDIVIGTHKLLQEDVHFKELGLLVIDEEHRFGVQQKERIKKFRAHIDILTLTATPIPRTLNMSMSGIRDISIIATPPARRLSIKTFVEQENPEVIREAVLREIMRGGQVFYLYNEVETIERFARETEKLIPEARVGVGHGQMRERELEQVMSDFYHRRFNVLVCTTIIENGIDIPTANTILMHRADKLGLAQLHQLRGRVGRSHHQAYAYLLTPPPESMSKDAHKRLEAISSLEDLGAGFTLATHDMEIRGAGELLGEGQSGNMEAIGFSLYMELLERTVSALKAGKKPPTNFEREQTDVDLGIPVLIPDDYLGDVFLRLQFYNRIALCKTEDALQKIQIELIDRFGMLPQAAKNLFLITELRNKAALLGIKSIAGNARQIAVNFQKDAPVNVNKIVALVSKFPAQYQLSGPLGLKYFVATEDAIARIEETRKLLELL